MIDNTKPCTHCDGEGQTPSKAYMGWYNCPKEYKAEFDINHPIESCKTCNGEGSLFYFGGEEERFNMLADRWEKETGISSRIGDDHPCFIEMKKMKSEEAMTWVLKRIQKKLSWIIVLFSLWTSKEDNPPLIDRHMRGCLKEITDAWLKWGIEKNLIK